MGGDKEGEKEKRSGKRVLLGWRELVKGNAKERERKKKRGREGRGTLAQSIFRNKEWLSL